MSEQGKSKQKTTTGVLPISGYVRQSQLLQVIPFSAATLWRKVKAGEFPRPVKLSERVTAWPVDDVREWMRKQSPQCLITNQNIGRKT